MTRTKLRRSRVVALVGLGALAAASGCLDDSQRPDAPIAVPHVLPGETGVVFDLTAKSDFISTGDGGSLFTWGYAAGSRPMQYPGPTLIVEEGREIVVNLANQLGVPVSILFPGQSVVATGGVQGELTREAPPGQTVSYAFRAAKPGTFVYYSGTDPALQVEMGLVGALVVRPALGPTFAYDHPSTRFDTENLFLLTEMDPVIHEQVAAGETAAVDHSERLAVYWFINGRNAPDTMLEHGVPWLPTQPYGAMAHMKPGDRLLMRVVNAGLDLHPFHHHGNHARIIGMNGTLLESQPGAGPDLSHEVFTIQTVPGETVDAIFEWTGEKLGWDIYGDPAERPHQCVDGNGDQFDDTTKEYCPDHGKPFPIILPDSLQLTFGAMYGGSPHLGAPRLLPPGEGGNNPEAAFPFMWHSHTEKEMTNNDIFPGGMMTMLMVESPVPVALSREASR